ncbi:MAG: hypothetical protein M1814_004196 [Vezdaea aestivalis]|nr:MAG: hypothetical protein M1814_004196 [Vezdaea aestivalis]
MSDVTPRVTASYLSNFTSQPAVRMVGQVTALAGDTATVDSQGSVQVQLTRDSHLSVGQYYEFIGKVVNLGGGLGLKVMSVCDWGSNIDMNLVAAVVEISHKYHEIHYE